MRAHMDPGCAEHVQVSYKIHLKGVIDAVAYQIHLKGVTDAVLDCSGGI